MSWFEKLESWLRIGAGMARQNLLYPCPDRREEKGIATRQERRTRRKRPSRSFQALLALLWLFGWFSLLLSPPPSHAQSLIQVGLVVQYAPGNVLTRCLNLSQPNPSGWDILQAANLNVVGAPSGMGMVICAIGDVGCPASDCWCKFTSGENLYWSYWHLKTSNWVYSNLGASNYTVSAGEIEGWVWGDGRNPPPLFTFEEICAATPTATATATSLPSATATHTVQPSWTPAFSPTSSPPQQSTPSLSSPTATISPIPMLAQTTTLPFTQPPIRTTTLTPSPTITLPFGANAFVTPSSAAQGLPSVEISAATQVEIDLQSLSLTATAVESKRQAGQSPEGDQLQTSAPFSPSNSNTPGAPYLLFFAISGGLLLLLMFVMRQRGAR